MIKLLLVEDDANLCYIIRGGLEDMIGGYEVMTASNGEEGLKIWKEQHLDIIISDIEMPVILVASIPVSRSACLIDLNTFNILSFKSN